MMTLKCTSNLLTVSLLFTAAAVVTFRMANPASKPVSIEREDKEAKPAAYLEARARYDFDMVKNPVTGKIPAGIRQQELAFAKTIPVRSYGSDQTARTTALNTYIPAGPNNIGGRTRTVQYDRRFNGGTNRVIIAGSVSGGILRSADGGTTWTRVSPENEIHNLTSLAQDPTSPDTWYAGGGEALGNSTTEVEAVYVGYGVYKSINNGVSWTRLPLNTITSLDGNSQLTVGVQETFDHPFDVVHKIIINPVTGDLYVAGHRRLVRSTDDGATFRVVFENTVALTASVGQMDVVTSDNGTLYLATNGGYSAERRGIWVSPTGNVNSWQRIAGGPTLGVDSVSGWRGNSSPSTNRRAVMALAPSNNNIGYVFYQNGEDSDNLLPEADFFKFDVSGGNYTWTNRSNNMPDFPGGNLSGSDPLTVQNGYDMEVVVRPDDPNTVFVGGTNLYRSIDGFATTNNTAWIGGYATTFTYSSYSGSHPDIHRLTFHPTDPGRAICGNDGGVQETLNVSAGTVAWTMLPNYQTLQCYNVAIDPGSGRNNFASGSQDNGVRLRDKTGVANTAAADSNNHRLAFSADGCYVGLSGVNAGAQYLYESIQLGRIYRANLANFPSNTQITPTGLTTNGTAGQFGEFVTNFRLNMDNSETIYYANFNRLFRTTAAATVTSSGWTELTGVSSAVNPSNPFSGTNIRIRGMAYSRGPYTTAHVLYIGTTNGKIFRLDDPQNTVAATSPIDITPIGMTGNVQDVATNPNNDDEVMAVVSSYGAVGIWWTKNAKSATPTWRNIEGNLTLPSFRSCAIVVKRDAANQPVTEYYVGTSVGLYSTINVDAAANPIWEREGGNLLNYAVVSTLSYRPVDNVLLVGTHGNGMYYTNIGTPNFTPNLNTAVTPPVVTNDPAFIRFVAPTVSSVQVTYQTGTRTDIRRIAVQLVSAGTGQVVYRYDGAYKSGTVPLQQLAAGVYILHISSDDNRYRHTQKIIRQ